MREDHYAAADRRVRRAKPWRDSFEWREHSSLETLPAQCQHRIPELRAFSAPNRAAECRVRIAAQGRESHRETSPRSSGAGAVGGQRMALYFRVFWWRTSEGGVGA